MKAAILEPDLEELDRALETFASSGHICFAAATHVTFRRLLTEVSVDLILIDWIDLDSSRYEILHHLAQYKPAAPVVLCVSPHTSRAVIESGLQNGASFCIEKPLRDLALLNSFYSLATNRVSRPRLAETV